MAGESIFHHVIIPILLSSFASDDPNNSIGHLITAVTISKLESILKAFNTLALSCGTRFVDLRFAEYLSRYETSLGGPTVSCPTIFSDLK